MDIPIPQTTLAFEGLLLLLYILILVGLQKTVVWGPRAGIIFIMQRVFSFFVFSYNAQITTRPSILEGLVEFSSWKT